MADQAPAPGLEPTLPQFNSCPPPPEAGQVQPDGCMTVAAAAAPVAEQCRETEPQSDLPLCEDEALGGSNNNSSSSSNDTQQGATRTTSPKLPDASALSNSLDVLQPPAAPGQTVPAASSSSPQPRSPCLYDGAGAASGSGSGSVTSRGDDDGLDSPPSLALRQDQDLLGPTGDSGEWMSSVPLHQQQQDCDLGRHTVC